MSNNQLIKQGADIILEGCLHTSSEDLSKLVSWAHSHGTICTVIPSLNHLLTEGSHGRLTAMWGCCAGHAYHWALTSACTARAKEPACGQDSRSTHFDSNQLSAGERILSRASKVKRVRETCNSSNCSDPSEADENNEEYSCTLLDIVCESSATDEDGDYETELQHAPRSALRKRGGSRLSHAHQRSEEGAGDSGGKKIKQEMTEDYYPPGRSLQLHKQSVVDLNSVLVSSSHSQRATLMPKPLRSPAPCGQSRIVGGTPSSSPLDAFQRLPGSSLESCQRVQSPLTMLQLSGQNELEPLSAEELGKSCASSAPYADIDTSPVDIHPEVDMGTDQNPEVSGAPALFEIERLKVLLQAERSKSDLMGETIKSLRQDKELLQQELTKKAELICDFLQDQLSHRPEKRRCHAIGQLEQSGSSQQSAVSPDEPPAFEPQTLFDSFDEMEAHPSERQKTAKLSKRNREGENTRVRMKNVVGVIARYMTALQEFRRSVSMKVAFDRVGVDRNTISRTAAIAELSLAAPEVFHSLPPWDEKEETLAHYAIRCRQAMDDNIKAKIKIMKAKGDLLPIVSK